MFPFLRTYKPVLKEAQTTPLYEPIRRLLQQWLFAKHIQGLLESQNRSLFLAAQEKDRLLAERPKPCRGTLLNRHASLGAQIVELKERIPRVALLARSMHKASQEARLALPKLQSTLTTLQAEKDVLNASLQDMGAWG